MKYQREGWTDTKSHNKIVLLGGGMLAEMANYILKRVYPQFRVVAIVDYKLDRVPWSEVPVINYCDLPEYVDENTTCILCASKSYRIVLEQAGKYIDIDTIYDIDYLLQLFKEIDEKPSFYGMYGTVEYEQIIKQFRYYSQRENNYPESVYIGQFNLVITRKCNLSCKYCEHYIPWHGERDDVPAIEIKEDLEKILSSIDGIQELELVGGEVFLHQDICEILSFIVESEKIKSVRIVTNGTIMPADDVWNIMTNRKIKLVIDDYGDLSKQLRNVYVRANSMGINCEVQKLKQWYKVYPESRKIWTQDEAQSFFENCLFSDCIAMYNHRIHRCNPAVHMYEFDLLPEKDDAGIILNKAKGDVELRASIKDLLNRKSLLACQYCNYGRKETVPVAEQVKRNV